MEVFELPVGVALVYSIQALGLMSAVLARMSERSPLQSACQALFLTSLVLMGFATVGSLLIGPGLALGSGAALAVMAVTAVCELKPQTDFETF